MTVVKHLKHDSDLYVTLYYYPEKAIYCTAY